MGYELVHRKLHGEFSVSSNTLCFDQSFEGCGMYSLKAVWAVTVTSDCCKATELKGTESGTVELRFLRSGC